MATLSIKAIHVGGIEADVYGLEELKGTGPIVAVVVLHGRTQKRADMDFLCRGIYEKASQLNSGQKTSGKEMIVVSFDQRNHGSRLVSSVANQSFGVNPTHLLDMYSIQTGTARDVSFLIDFLPAYIFPRDERVISDWIVVGISLGGHSTWIVLKDEPRVKIGIPIIGCPDYLSLLFARATASGLNLTPPTLPKSLSDIICTSDPVSAPYTSPSTRNPFYGKKILVISGAVDKLVPYEPHTRVFFDGLEVGEDVGGKKEAVILDGVGHECPNEAVERAGEWIWKYGMKG